MNTSFSFVKEMESVLFFIRTYRMLSSCSVEALELYVSCCMGEAAVCAQVAVAVATTDVPTIRGRSAERKA